MGSLNSLYIKTDTIKQILDTLNKKGEKGISLTVSINDDANDYGQNVTAFVEQSKEQREAKAQKFYVGNGKTFWTDGTIKVPEKKQDSAPAGGGSDDEDLPF